MASISLSWAPPPTWVDIAGHRIHAGKVSGVWTHVSSNIPAPGISGTITVPTEGNWYVTVAAYNASGHEGTYSPSVIRPTEGTIQPPIVTIVASLR